MDAFKNAEVKRMEFGGNRPWKGFFNAHQSNKMIGRDFDSCTISERYDSEAGEEWKDRLTAKVEGTEYLPGSSKKVERAVTGVTPAGSGRNTPLSSVRSPPAGGAPQRTVSPSQKARNEAYFASKGSENASRPEGLAPSQGGKYSGFGSSPPPTNTPNNNSSGALPTGDDFQSDPVAALTKGFGWLSSTVTKQAASMNKTYIQPGIQSLQEGELAAQARGAAMQAGTYVQQGAKGMGDQFNRFVDPDHSGAGAGAPSGQRGAPVEKKDFWDSFGQPPSGPPQEKKDFWESFGQVPEMGAAGAGAGASGGGKSAASIGTSAMKTHTSSSAAGKKDEGWGEW